MKVFNNIAEAEVKICGTRAILWHKFGMDSLSLIKKEKTGAAGNDPDEWKKSVLVTSNNQLYIEPSYIFACLRDGAKYTKKGRASLQSTISATLQILDEEILIDRFLPECITTDKSSSVFLDISGVKNPCTKARNIRYRVCASSGWNATFHINWDKTLISKAEMEAVVIDAGMFSGLGDGRSIGYGRFEVNSFEVKEIAEKTPS